jgi:hypothetical protein
MTRQMEIEGTERKYSKAMRKAGDELAEAIKAQSKAASKRKEKEAAALQQMKADDLGLYVDTESDPPFQLVRGAEETIVKKPYKAPKPNHVDDESEPQEAEEGEQRARKKKPAGGASAEA